MAATKQQEVGERRRFGRVVPVQRLRGSVNNVPVYIVDVSLNGVRVAHQATMPPVGENCVLTFDWDGHRIILDCALRRTKLEIKPETQFAKALYHSGLEILEPVGDSEALLRELVESCVNRALDEQRANARGIPAIAAQSFQTGKGDEFIRCELVNGEWRQGRTKSSDQPTNGFTISSEEGPDKILMLCRAYESADNDGRRLIRTFASLSVSRSEGIPTRRYTP